MDWDDLQVFLAVHRLGSYKGAARILRIDATTVGRRLAALESALGARLFARTPERMIATAVGERLILHAERMETEAHAAERELQGNGDQVDGALRVTATDSVVHYLMVPALGALRREHPRLSIELRIDTRVLDLSRREADIAVRLARPKEPALVARQLGEIRWALFASRDYLQRRGTPRNTPALAAHDFVGFDPNLDGLPEIKWLHRLVRAPRYFVRTSNAAAQVLACAEGNGIALLPGFVASREVRLVRLLSRVVGPVRPVWGVMHVDLRNNPRASACMAWLGRVIGEAREA